MIVEDGTVERTRSRQSLPTSTSAPGREEEILPQPMQVDSPAPRSTRSVRKEMTLPTPSTSSKSTSASPAYEVASPEHYADHNLKPLIVKLSLGGGSGGGGGDRSLASATVLPPTPAADSSSPRAKRIRKSSRAVLEEQEMRLEAPRAESVFSDQASTVGADPDEDFGGVPVVKRRKSSTTSQKLNTTCHHDKSRKDTPKMSCTEISCNLLWCEKCITKYYSGPTDPPFVADGKFKCPVCRKVCQCTAHRQRVAQPARTSRKQSVSHVHAMDVDGEDLSDGEGVSVVKRGKRRAHDADVADGFLGQLISVNRQASHVRPKDLEDSSTHEMSEDESEDESEDDPKVWIEGPLRRDRKVQDTEALLERGESEERDGGGETRDDAEDDETALYDLIDIPSQDSQDSKDAVSSLPSPADSAPSPNGNAHPLRAPVLPSFPFPSSILSALPSATNPALLPIPTRPSPPSHDSYKPSHYASSTPPTIHSHSRPQSTTPMMLVPAVVPPHLHPRPMTSDAATAYLSSQVPDRASGEQATAKTPVDGEDDDADFLAFADAKPPALAPFVEKADDVSTEFDSESALVGSWTATGPPVVERPETMPALWTWPGEF
ncbi:hypothetical protein RQP46_004965 [Phenoliferia psychrophenolica]